MSVEYSVNANTIPKIFPFVSGIERLKKKKKKQSQPISCLYLFVTIRINTLNVFRNRAREESAEAKIIAATARRRDPLKN